MKHKVCLLFTFLSLSVSGISATNGQDSIRQIQLSDLEVQIRWVNPTAIRAYLDDTKTALGGKAPALYEKLSRLETLLPGVRQAFSDKVSSNATDEVIGQAQEILALKREIILANPLLDMDKIIVARYRLGNKARKAMGPSMGTSTANYNSLFSNSRKGYDAEIDLLTGLRGQIEAWPRKQPDKQTRSRCSHFGHTAPLGCRPPPLLLARQEPEVADIRNEHRRKQPSPKDHR